MRAIQSLNELSLPKKHKKFLDIFIGNVCVIPNRSKIERLILFGSCARGEAVENSDIDIVAIGERIDNTTLFEMYDCVPEYRSESYVENDILAITSASYDKSIASYEMVQKYIDKEGVT